MTLADREALKQQLIQHEGLRLSPYEDSTGHLTIGVGHNVASVPISQKAAMVILDDDIDTTVRQLASQLSWFADLDPERQIALCDLAFNLGVGGLLLFTKALAAMARKDYETAAREFESSAWYRQVGVRGPAVVAQIRYGGEGA